MCASDRLARSLVCGLLVVTAALAANPAMAQQTSREQEQIRRLRLQVQQLQQQAQGQTALQQSLQQAAAELATLKKALAEAQAASSRSKAAVDRQVGEAAATQQQLDQARQAAEAQTAAQQALRTELAAAAQARATLGREQAELQRQLLAREADWAALNARHTSQAQGLQACIDNNQALHALGQDLVQRYGSLTVAELLQRDEPFLQFRRVALENLLQGYRDKLDAQALLPPGPAAALPAAQRLAASPGPGRAAP